MVYRIAGGFFLVGLGLQWLGILSVPDLIIGLAALVAGIALWAGY